MATPDPMNSEQLNEFQFNAPERQGGPLWSLLDAAVREVDSWRSEAIEWRAIKAERDRLAGQVAAARDVAAEHHDIHPEAEECFVGCPGCQVERALAGGEPDAG